MWSWGRVLRTSLSFVGAGRGRTMTSTCIRAPVPPPSLLLVPFSNPLKGHNHNKPLNLNNLGNLVEISDPGCRRILPVEAPKDNHQKGRELIIPGASKWRDILEDPVPSLRIAIEEAPPTTRRMEKQAARLIVIRRSKMNKHKLRKLRKKMHYKWAKVKERRYARKQKEYLDQKMALIKDALSFDAKDYVASVIRKAKEEPLPRKWTDPLMPEWFREQEMDKERRLHRFQKVINMYLNAGIKIKLPK